MGNRKNKILVIVIMSILYLTTGCAITITRNQYYSYPNQREKSPVKNETKKNSPADSLTNTKYGQN